MSSAYEPTAAVGPQLRRRVRALLAKWDVDDVTVDDALLAVEEFVANVLDHARTPFRFTVRLAARGRGLQLVASLAQRRGCEHHPDRQDGLGRAARRPPLTPPAG